MHFAIVAKPCVQIAGITNYKTQYIVSVASDIGDTPKEDKLYTDIHVNNL